MQTFIADTLEVLRIGFWATVWSLLGSCLIALAFAWGEQLFQRSASAARSVYSGPGARTGTILMLIGIAALACSWSAWAILGGGPRADTLGEQVTKAVSGTAPEHIALLAASVVAVLLFSWGAIQYLYSEHTEGAGPAPAVTTTEPAKAA